MLIILSVEAPVKFLYTSPPSDIPRSYPFSVLGLGDGKRRLIYDYLLQWPHVQHSVYLNKYFAVQLSYPVFLLD
jgi:hypothetical protein